MPSGEQVDIPGNGSAEAWVYVRAITKIGEVEDVDFDIAPSCYPLIERSTVLNGIEVQDT